MKVAFYSPHLSERGTEVAMYDYAYYNEKILGNESIILHCPSDNRNHPSAVEKFNNQFRVFGLDGPNFNFGWQKDIVVPLIDKVLSEQKCDVLYMQKGGTNDGVVSSVCKTVILCASNVNDVHGDRYAYVSKWLSDVSSGGKLPWLPIIIDLPSSLQHFRKELQIPEDAIVFGRSGGMDTWNVPWANAVIAEVLKRRSDIYFIFQNTPIHFNHPRVKYIQTTVDSIFKCRFINTCDAMIHAREDGESFGQTIAEFSTKNKPIITYGSPSIGKNHILMLGDSGIYYNTPEELFAVLMQFTKMPNNDWNCYKDHTPMNGMKKFKEIFLDNLL